MQYAIVVTKEHQTYLITCPDLPEVNAIAYSKEDITQQAIDAIETAFMLYMQLRWEIPLASKKIQTDQWIKLPLKTSLKVALYNELLKQRVSKAELARRLNCDQVQIDHLWSIQHSTKLETIEAAFCAIGKHLDICVV